MSVPTTDTDTTGVLAPEPPKDSVMDIVRRVVRRNIRQYGMLIALAVIVLLFQVKTGGTLLKPLNVTNLIQQNGYILILAIGMVIVIIAGHIDLSVGSVSAFIGAIAAVMMVDHGVPWLLAVLLCLVAGAGIGAAQGYFIAHLGIPSFIVTLAGMLVFRGATLVVLKSTSIGPFPNQFQKASSGFLPNVGPNTGYHNLTLLIGALVIVGAIVQEVRARRVLVKYGFETLSLPWFIAKCAGIVVVVTAFTVLLANYRGYPAILLILGVLTVVYSFVMRDTVIGRHIYAVGGNQAAARLSGVKNKRVVTLVFVNMGMLAALGGLVAAARLNAGTPTAGTNFELEAIAAAFIGGASASGGVGTVLGAIIGGLVLGVLNNGMSLIGVGIDWQQVIKGLVLLAAVGFDVYNKRKGVT